MNHPIGGGAQFGDRIGTENGCWTHAQYCTRDKSDRFHKKTDGPGLLAGYL